MDDNTPITWGSLKRILERAERTADIYSESQNPHEEIAQGTAGIALAHLGAAVDDERQAVELAEALAAEKKA